MIEYSAGPETGPDLGRRAGTEIPAPLPVGDLLHVKAQINWTGKTSMEVGVRVVAERWNESGPAKHVASAPSFGEFEDRLDLALDPPDSFFHISNR